MLFYLKKLVTVLVLPPTGCLLLALAGLLLLARGRRRSGFVLALTGVLVLFALSLPLVATALTLLVSDASVLDARRVSDRQAIVVLGGGIRRHAQEYAGDTPSSLGLDRLRYAARLARQTSLPVLITGGVVYSGEPEALVMRDVLQTEYGVPVRWVEPKSRNTHQNAVFTHALLKPEGVTRVLLVTHAVDSRRARREFEAAGFDVVVAPTHVPDWRIDSFMDLLPSMAALQGSYLALYELAGNLALMLGANG